MIFIKWFVYMLECRDGTLYTGITNDLSRRLDEHNQGIGCKYTRGRNPVVLRGYREVDTRAHATALEYQIKRMNRSSKLKTAAGWIDINK